MLLKNKKTGEIREYGSVGATTFGKEGVLEAFAVYDSLAELNEEWEDYEESEEYWIVTDCGGVSRANANPYMFKEIGNYFETKEEAEKAVEKLKAWKRLKENNVKFNLDFVKNQINFTYSIDNSLIDVLDGEEQIYNNMKIVFGGEE
jgi:hypothetical protein